MHRTIQQALVTGAVALTIGAVALVGTPTSARAQTVRQQPPMQHDSMHQMMAQQPTHKAQALQHTQAALDAANAGRNDSVLKEAKQALSEAKQAQQAMPTKSLSRAVDKLQIAVNQAKAGNTKAAKQAVQMALYALRAG